MKRTLEQARDGGVGNTITPPKTKQQSTQSKHWCFTFNNYAKEDIRAIEQALLKNKKYVFQEETGENGTPHLQGYTECFKKRRFEEFKLPKEIHWERTNNIEASIAYCQKPETRTGDIYKHGFPKDKKKALDGMVLYDWQKEIEELFFTEPDGRSIHWYCDLKGNIGKSVFTKYMYQKHKIVVSDCGKRGDILHLIYETNMDDVKMMIFDIPRGASNNISYTAIESILNGLIASTKYEGGMKDFDPPHIIVFCNTEPKYDQCSEDRWKVTTITEALPCTFIPKEWEENL